jgi:hypothetical protein
MNPIPVMPWYVIGEAMTDTRRYMRNLALWLAGRTG